MDRIGVTVAAGASGAFTLYEDDGVSPLSKRATTTRLRYAEHKGSRLLKIGPAEGAFTGQVSRRAWTVSFRGVEQPPGRVTADGARLSASAWQWDADTHTLRVSVPARSIRSAVTVRYR